MNVPIEELANDPNLFMSNVKHWIAGVPMTVNVRGNSIVLEYQSTPYERTEPSAESKYALDFIAEALRTGMSDIRQQALSRLNYHIGSLLERVTQAFNHGKKQANEPE